LAPLLEEGPLVIKPYQEGGQVKIVRTPAELAQVELGRDPVFAQRYHPPQDRDCKIYVIGGQLFGVKKVFPRRTEEEKLGEPFTLTPELSDMARRGGGAFEIGLYGMDVIESEGKAYVVDMDSIPGYKGVPDAPLLLARYLYDAVERAVFLRRRAPPRRKGSALGEGAHPGPPCTRGYCPCPRRTPSLRSRSRPCHKGRSQTPRPLSSPYR